MGSFSDGLLAGAALKQSKPNRELAKKEAQLAQQQQTADLIRTQIEQSREQTSEAIKGITEGVAAALKNGAAPDDENIMQSMMLVEKLLNTQTRIQQEIVSFAEAEGFPAEKAYAAFGVPGDFAQNQAAQVAGALQLAGLSSTKRAGRAEGEGTLAGAEAMLGRPLTESERRELAKVAPSSPLVTIDQKQNSAFVEKLGEDEAALVSKTREDASRARGRLIEIERIEAALDSGNFETGVFSDARVFLGRLFEFINVAPPENIVGDAATADTLDAAANRLGIEVAKDMSRITNLSLDFIKNSLPQLTRTVEGNRILAEVMKRSELRKIKIGDIANEYARRGGLQPDEGPSYFDKIDEMDREDPVIDDALRKRILEGTKGAPSSFSTFTDPRRPFVDAPPAGIPAGSEKAFKKNGRDVWRTPDGKLVMSAAEANGD